MKQELPSTAPPPPTRGEKIALIFFGTLFFAIGGFAAIAEVCGHLGYDLFGRGDWGVLPWTGTHLLAIVAMIVALSIVEGVEAGSLATYTTIGVIVGMVCFMIASTGDSGKGYWIVAVQYSLIGHLLGRFNCRDARRPQTSPEAAETPGEPD